jgi:hypothetical protein
MDPKNTTLLSVSVSETLSPSPPQQQQQQQQQQHISISTKNGTTNNTNSIIHDISYQNRTANVTTTVVQLLMSAEEVRWLQDRPSEFRRWFRRSMMDYKTRKIIQPQYDLHMRYFVHDADADHPWFDFLIAGFPKCGTTTLMATLGRYVAPMPVKDVCEWPPTVLTRAYTEWPKRYGGGDPTTGTVSPLLLRGSKCPSVLSSLGGAYLKIFSNSFRRTKLIVGIRYVSMLLLGSFVAWFVFFVGT